MKGTGDYISREAALRDWPLCDEPGDAYQFIRNFPAADVRPVVTCGECKYWELSKIYPPLHVCTYVCGATFVREAEDFCSRGERMAANDV